VSWLFKKLLIKKFILLTGTACNKIKQNCHTFENIEFKKPKQRHTKRDLPQTSKKSQHSTEKNHQRNTS
jgi:hypothetical protein